VGAYVSLCVGVYLTEHISAELEYRVDAVSGTVGTSQATLDLDGQSAQAKLVFDF
jgi:hypothetical protein